MNKGIYILEPVRVNDLDTGHEVPAVRATCRMCGLEETMEGSGGAAESGAESALRARCIHGLEGAKVNHTGAETWDVTYPTGWRQSFRELGGKITNQGWSRVSPPPR